MMNLTIEPVDVWAASIKDKPGGLAGLLQGLREAGADLEFVVARRTPEKAGGGVVFVTPLRGDREVSAASTLGFNATNRLHSIRVEGDNRPGVAAEIAQVLADKQVNLRGFSAAVIGTRFIAHVGVDSAEDSKKAIGILKGL